jgi:hypothetical protein
MNRKVLSSLCTGSVLIGIGGMCITGIMLSNDKPVPNNDSGKGNNYEK